MKSICKNCKWWDAKEYGYGYCEIINANKIQENPLPDVQDRNIFIFKNFGCINFKEKQ